MKFNNDRLDIKLIVRLVETGSKVLDLGCGSGELLFQLVREKQAKVEGIEMDDEAIFQCVEKGLSATHRDIDSGLAEYPDQSFDYVILNQSLQQVKQVDYVIAEALRVGKKVIVGFPNFLHYAARFQMFFGGKVPVTPSLPFKWYSTPNLHFLSIADFWEFTREEKIKVLQARYLGEKFEINFLPNLLAKIGLFVLSNEEKNNETDN